MGFADWAYYLCQDLKIMQSVHQDSDAQALGLCNEERPQRLL
jgi:hypothetical protein